MSSWVSIMKKKAKLQNKAFYRKKTAIPDLKPERMDSKGSESSYRKCRILVLNL